MYREAANESICSTIGSWTMYRVANNVDIRSQFIRAVISLFLEERGQSKGWLIKFSEELISIGGEGNNGFYLFKKERGGILIYTPWLRPPCNISRTALSPSSWNLKTTRSSKWSCVTSFQWKELKSNLRIRSLDSQIPLSSSFPSSVWHNLLHVIIRFQCAITASAYDSSRCFVEFSFSSPKNA